MKTAQNLQTDKENGEDPNKDKQLETKAQVETLLETQGDLTEVLKIKISNQLKIMLNKCMNEIIIIIDFL